MSIAIFSHSDCLKHDTGVAHPESPARLSGVLDALRSCSFADKLHFAEAPMALREQLLLVHTAEYLEFVERSAPADKSLTQLDLDTILSHDSFKAALRAAGAGCEAVGEVMKGNYTSAFCAVRPPGHHACSDKAMGFCIFNNAAIAAHHAMQAYALAKVAIVDFDVHHGNGTQAIFADDIRVCYVSMHQYPYWPGTGRFDEKGMGNIINIELPSRTSGVKYRDLFSAVTLPALRAHRPEMILVSAGFDAHRDDPLASLGLNEDDYRWIGQELASLARECCNGRIVSLLEGGYHLPALAASTVSYLSAFV